MNIDSIVNTINTYGSFEALKVYTKSVSNLVVEAFGSIKIAVSSATESLSSPVQFTDLQFTLLKVLLTILTINLILTGYYWRKYGTIITDRFIRPSTLKEIEELKSSVAKLKLPKEHTPRI